MTRWLMTAMLRVRSLLRRGQVEQELHDEMTFHLDGLIEDYQQRGLTPEAARLAAMRELGPVESLKEECRDARGVTYLEQFAWDVRLAVRAYLRQPGFTTVALLVLALGIGANTAIYTLVDAVAWRPLPVDRPMDLYRVGDTNACCVRSGLSGDTSLFSYDFFLQLRDHAPAFAALAAFQVVPESLSARRGGATDRPQAISSEFVSGSYFETLQTGMAAGRPIRPDDDRLGAPPVGVLSYYAWRDEFGRDPALLGGTLLVSGSPVTIVGVAAPMFFGETLRPNPVELWLPLTTEFRLSQNRQGIVSATGASTSLLERPDQEWLYVIGRLRAGITPAAAQDEASLALRLWLGRQGFLSADERAEIPAQHVTVTSFETGVSPLRARYRESLTVLAIVSGLVLVLACANLGNLMLARARPFQLALRAALGASQGRLIRATLTSGLVLAVAGGAAGVTFAYAGTRLILSTAFPGARDVPIDARPSLPILAFAAIASVATGLIFSGLPAWLASKTNPIEVLRSGVRATGHRFMVPRQILIVLQIAVSLVLVSGAGLLTRSLGLLEAPVGFETSNRMVVRLDPAAAGYSIDRLPELYERLPAELQRVPSVAGVSLSQYSPMSGFNWEGPISLEDRPVDAAHHLFSTYLRVGPHYFEAIGTPLLRGRAIDERDTASSLHVVVINRTFGDRFFPSADPIGHRLAIGEEPGHNADYQIVGIVQDVKYADATRPAEPTIFMPLLQTVPYGIEGLVSMQARSLFINSVELHLRPGAEAGPGVEANVRLAFARIDPNLTPLAIMTFADQVDRNFIQQTLMARLTSLYSGLGLLLAALGLYGVTAQYVTARTREIGVRVALGADRRSVLTMILRRAAGQTIMGVAIGVPVALGVARLIASQLYGVTGHDPIAFGAALIVVVLSTQIAALVPARRAAAIDPIQALRVE